MAGELNGRIRAFAARHQNAAGRTRGDLFRRGIRRKNFAVKLFAAQLARRIVRLISAKIQYQDHIFVHVHPSFNQRFGS